MVITAIKNKIKVKISLIIPLLFILTIYTSTVFFYLYPRNTIKNLDFWYHISVGRQLQWGNPHTFVDGLYPLGYPLLLSSAIQAGIDALRFGQFLAWFGGLLVLLACFFLIYLITEQVIFSIVGTFLLFFNIHFLSYATYEGNDMLAAGLQAASITVIWWGTTRKKYFPFSKQLFILHGFLLGFAYLTRYTALTLLPVSLIYIILLYYRSPRHLCQGILYVLIPFFIITSIQIIPSWYIYGNLFYNEQAKNIWFGIYGEQDWVKNWGKIPENIGIIEVITIDPIRFFSHWLYQIYVAFAPLRLWPLPLHIAWIIALPLLFLSKKFILPQRLFLLMSILVPLIVTALAWLAPRFLLLSLWGQAVLIVWLFFYLVSLIPIERQKNSLLFGLGASLAMITILLQWPMVKDWFSTAPMIYPQETNFFLRVAGMKTGEQVATNNPYLHVVDEINRSRYQQTISVNPTPNTVENLLIHPNTTNWQYLVIDYQYGFGNYMDLRDKFKQSKSLLVPLRFSEYQDIFCIMPCYANEFKPHLVIFENGMQLMGYIWNQTEYGNSLYLYWQTKNKLTNSYKISVRVIDLKGQEIVQIDNVPQLWTFSTVDWPPNTLIVDFYSWEVKQCEGCRLFIVVYDENSLTPLLATTEMGQKVGPLIDLFSISE